MMRVALISPPFESVPPRYYGGTERVVYNLCRGLTDNNIEVTLFASGDSCAEGRLIPVIDEAMRLSQKKVADPSAHHLRMLGLVAEHAHEFDVIHNHHDYWMLPLSEMSGTPVLTTLHGRLDSPDSGRAFRAFPKANFVSISDRQRDPVPDLRWVRTVHNGIDVNDFEFHPRPGKYLAFLGRMDSDKRPDYAIEIAKRSGVPLKMAAKIEGPAGQAYYDTYVKPHVDGKFIEYVGEITEAEKSNFLGEAMALVFPIDWPEPFGLVMVEALACGTPVLARPCGAAPEVLADGITGYCHSDIRVLADRVQDAARLDRTRCRQWIEQRFSLKRMTEDYIHVYRYLAEFAAARERTGAAGGIRRANRHRRDFLYPVERVADGNS